LQPFFLQIALAPNFIAVRWTNPRMHGDAHAPPQRGTACHQGRGDWHMI